MLCRPVIRAKRAASRRRRISAWYGLFPAAFLKAAIRTAMGQLLDYQQPAKGNASLLIVIEVEPNEQDINLATADGFGIAYPSKNTFKVV